MKPIVIILLLFLCSGVGKGQTVEISYFKNERLTKEAPKSEAKFSRSRITHADSSITIEVYDLQQDELLQRESFRGEEPIGVWQYRTPSGIRSYDFDFPLVYIDACEGNFPVRLSDYFEDIDSIAYKAPVFKNGERNIFEFVTKNIQFPVPAREQGLRGLVVVAFTITAEGKVENVAVRRGKHVLLDKEAVRTIRLLEFIEPGTLNGQPQRYECVYMPFRFNI